MHIPMPTRVNYRGYRLRQGPEDLQRPTQLGLPFYGKTVDVDGLFDERQ